MLDNDAIVRAHLSEPIHSGNHGKKSRSTCEVPLLYAAWPALAGRRMAVLGGPAARDNTHCWRMSVHRLTRPDWIANRVSSEVLRSSSLRSTLVR